MSPSGASVSASSRMPSEWTPSSLVTRMRGMGNFDDSTRFFARCEAWTAYRLIMKTGSMLLDQHQRPLRNLRLSVTDRCNLRCSYCMPEAEYVWLPREDILHFEEIETLVDVFLRLGVDKVRLTGGEPLLRKNVTDLVARLAARPGIRDLAMTTNGV